MRYLPVVATVVVLAGCCGYSTRSLLPSHLRTVSIPPAGNTTTQPGLGENLTDALVKAFNTDRTMRVVAEAKADLEVSAAVSGYSRQAASYTGNQSINAYDIVVTAAVTAHDRVRDEDFYSGTASATVTYNPETKTEEAAAGEAITKLAGEIVRQVLTTW